MRMSRPASPVSVHHDASAIYFLMQTSRAEGNHTLRVNSTFSRSVASPPSVFASPLHTCVPWLVLIARHPSISDEWEFGRHLYLTVLEISNINLMLPGKMLTETPENNVVSFCYRDGLQILFLFNSSYLW
jgi:hypothetical protein